MRTQLKNLAREILPDWAKNPLVDGLTACQGVLHYPKNKIIYLRAKARRNKLRPSVDTQGTDCRRIFRYDYSRVPNAYIAELESESDGLDSAISRTGLTVGYPAWNLLYYALLCSLPPGRKEFVIVETGTNHGFSTIVMAQVLKDLGVNAVVRTVDIDGLVVESAKEHIRRAGLSEYVEFHVGDSRAYLSELVRGVEYIDFAFLDSCHEYNHVRTEFSIIYPRVVACRGMVYFDNTTSRDVTRILLFIRRSHGGNLIEFQNCSWSPPGNAIWQSD